MIKDGKQVDSRAEAVVAVDSVAESAVAVDSVAESAVAVDSVAESTISVDSTVEPIFAADTTFEPAPSLTIKPSDTTSESRYISQLQNSNTNPTSCQLQLRLFHQSLQIEALEKDLHKSQSRTSNLEIQVGDLKAKLKRQNVHVALLLGEMDLGEKLLDFQAHVEKLLRQENQALMGEHTEDAQATVRFLDDVMLRLKVALVAERRKMEAEKAKWKEEKVKLQKKHRAETNELTNKYDRLEMTHKNLSANWDAERAQLNRLLSRKRHKSVQQSGQKLGLSNETKRMTNHLTHGVRSENRALRNKDSKNTTSTKGRTITGISPWALMKALREVDLIRNTSSTRDLRRI